jgi:CelD/BcsL family acetyltransferase involved in cellulose biosynthesis
MRTGTGLATVDVHTMFDLRPQHSTRLDLGGASCGLPAGPAHVELVTTLDGLERLKPDYDRLNRSTGNRLPFALHDWHVAWWKHFAARSEWVQDSLAIYVVRDRLDQCLALVPFVATDRFFGPLRLRTMSMLGPDPYISEFRGPLVHPGCEVEVVRLLRGRLAADGQWDWILWSGARGPFAEALAADGQVEWRDGSIDYLLELPSTWDAFRAGLKRNIRESVRHCYNSLKRDGLQFELEVAWRPADVSVALEDFFALHAMRAHLTETIPHPDRFKSLKTKDFLREVCLRLAARGVTRIFLLKIRSKVVAVRIGFVVGQSLYLYFSGYDPEWRKYSVMTTTVAEAIKYAIAEKLTTVSLSAGTDVSKTRWGATPVVSSEALECRRALRSQIAHKAYRHAIEWKGRTGPAMAAVLELIPKRAW